MSSANENKKLQNIQVGPPSPKFGGAVQKAGKYGQSQYQFIKHSKQNAANVQKRKISSQQLMSHRTKKSAWMSLKGIVYDVTQYVKHHPGGDVILQGCGKQSQQLFNEHHPWVNAKSILSHCVVGTFDHAK